jgi:hypothetical protein
MIINLFKKHRKKIKIEDLKIKFSLMLALFFLFIENQIQNREKYKDMIILEKANQK